MNFYQLHSKPETLDHYAAAIEKVPKLVWKKYICHQNTINKNAAAKDNQFCGSASAESVDYIRGEDVRPKVQAAGWRQTSMKRRATVSSFVNLQLQDYIYEPEELKKREHILAKDQKCACYYARYILKRPFPAGEKVIAANPKWAHKYACFVLNGPFPAGEAAIARDAQWAYNYARFVLKGPFPAGEAAIAADPQWAYYYAKHILNGPFPAGEATIAADPKWAYAYARDILKGPFPAGEAAIAANQLWAYDYANDVLKLSKAEAKVWGKR